MSLVVDEAHRETGRRLWVGVGLVVLTVLAVAAFFVGRAHAQQAKADPPPAASATASDHSGVTNATQ